MKSKLRDIWTPKRPTRDKLRNYKSLVNPQIQMTIGTENQELKIKLQMSWRCLYEFVCFPR